jgi:hypothetical protein
MSKDIEAKINILKQNLLLFKRAYHNAKNDSDEAFERVIRALDHDYHYRGFLEKQVEIYKKALKNLSETDKRDDKYQSLNVRAINEKYKLEDMLKTYNRVRDIKSFQIAEDKALIEAEAKDFLLNCQSELIGAMMELNGYKSDELIEEAKKLISLHFII